MSSAFARPSVHQLVYRLYDRAVHPEFFQTLALRKEIRPHYQLVVRMTPMGHVLEWQSGDTIFVEVTATATQELPQRSRINYPFLNSRRGRYERRGAVFQVNLQAEFLEPEQYQQVHEELIRDSKRPETLFHTRPRVNDGLPPLGLVWIQNLSSGLHIATYHTFPEDRAIIKTQTLIEPRTTPRSTL